MESLMYFCHNNTTCVFCSNALQHWSLWNSRGWGEGGEREREKKNNPKQTQTTRKQKRCCKYQRLFLPVHINRPPFFPTDTFHSRVYFTYIWFYCSRWQAHLGLLWAMVKREGGKKKKEPNELLLVTDCAFLSRGALQSSSITGPAQDRWAAVGSSSCCCRLAESTHSWSSPISSCWCSRTTPRPPPHVCGKTCSTLCPATAWKRGWTRSDRWYEPDRWSRKAQELGGAFTVQGLGHLWVY